MTDIFHEVEEDVRRERFEKLWKQYGDYAIAGVAAVIIGVAGYKFWQRYEYQQRIQASSAFSSAEQQVAAGNSAQAAQIYANIAKTAPSGYAAVAQLAEADALYSVGKVDEATALYRTIVQKGSSPIAEVARVRLAWATVDTTPKGNIEALLAPINKPDSAWRFMAREILAYADYRSGAEDQAQKDFASLAADSAAPQTIRGRANAIATFLKAGGDRDFGKVPMPPTPPASSPQQGKTSP